MVFLHRALVLEVLAFVLVLGEIKASNWKRQKVSKALAWHEKTTKVTL